MRKSITKITVFCDRCGLDTSTVSDGKVSYIECHIPYQNLMEDWIADPPTLDLCEACADSFISWMQKK